MPLVQSLEILRRRVTNPVFKSVLDDVHERVRSGTRCRTRSSRMAACSPASIPPHCWPGKRAAAWKQVIRRYVAYVKVVSSVKRKTISALVYPMILLVLSLIVVGIIVIKVVPEFGAFYEQFGAELPLSTRIIVAVSEFAGSYFLLLVLDGRRPWRCVLGLARPARQPGPVRPLDARDSDAWARSRRNSRPRRRRARWRRCSAAVFRW